ncbi:MAG: hypothetical protein ABI808_01050 [Pseudonocardiales bacterium]
MTRYAIRLLWLALAVQACWLLVNGLVLHRSPGLDVLGAVIGLSVAGFAARYRRPTGAAVLIRAVMAADFLLAVADRFGLLGAPGAPGVSWGNFTQFVDYTHTVTVFVPRGVAPLLAVTATVAESTLGLALLLGIQLRRAALCSAALLGVYGVCMTLSLPLAAQFHYNVFILAATMLALAVRHPTTLTVDQWLTRRSKLDQRTARLSHPTPQAPAADGRPR